jgi:hypothetical protein
MASRLLVALIRALLPIISGVHTRLLGIRSLKRNSIICVEVTRHKGCPIRLQDGCDVRPGDPVIKLHFSNAWIAATRRSSSGSGTGEFPRGFGQYFKEGLQLLATEVADAKYGSIVAIYGWTAFHAQAKRFGFQVIDLPDTLRIKLARLHIAALMEDHRVPWLKKRATSHKPLQVKAVWLSRGELLRIHGTAS